jgi:hypothetical protein
MEGCMYQLPETANACRACTAAQARRPYELAGTATSTAAVTRTPSMQRLTERPYSTRAAMACSSGACAAAHTTHLVLAAQAGQTQLLLQLAVLLPAAALPLLLRAAVAAAAAAATAPAASRAQRGPSSALAHASELRSGASASLPTATVDDTPCQHQSTQQLHTACSPCHHTAPAVEGSTRLQAPETAWLHAPRWCAAARSLHQPQQCYLRS